MKALLETMARNFRVSPRQLAMVAGTLLVLAEVMALLESAAPVMMMHMFDGVMESRSVNTLVALCLLFLVLCLLNGVLFVQRQALIKAGCALLERRLMVTTVRAAMRLARDGRAEDAALALHDFNALRRFLASGTINDALVVLSLPMPILLMYALHPVLGIIIMVGCVAMAMLSLVAERRGRKGLRESSVASGRAAMMLNGFLRRRDEVEGLGLLAGIIRHWMPLRRAALDQHEQAFRRNQAINSIAAAMLALTGVALSAFSVWGIIHHLMAPATFIISYQVTQRVLRPCQSLAEDWTQWGEAWLSYQRLQATLRLVEGDSAVPPAEVSDPDLHILGLRLEVPGTDAVLVDDLNLRVQPGSVVVVSGRNGTGKSTLMRALIGLARPAAGGVLFHGVAMDQAERGAIGPRIGFLGQRAQLLNGSILDNICRFDADADVGFRAARQAGAHEMIGRLAEGYSTPVDWGSALSGGQQRQIAMARALAGDPALVVLDEPEVGLDAPALQSLVAAVTALRERGAIVFLVSHDRKRWADVADLELRLDGRGSWSTRLLKPQPMLENA